MKTFNDFVKNGVQLTGFQGVGINEVQHPNKIMVSITKPIRKKLVKQILLYITDTRGREIKTFTSIFL